MCRAWLERAGVGVPMELPHTATPKAAADNCSCEQWRGAGILTFFRDLMSPVAAPIERRVYSCHCTASGSTPDLDHAPVCVRQSCEINFNIA